jgi:hypothetical protein
MEVVTIFVAIYYLICFTLSVMLTSTLVLFTITLTLVYVKKFGYHDGSENTRERFYPWFRDYLSSFVNTFARNRTNYRIIYRSYKDETNVVENDDDNGELRLYDEDIADENDIMTYLMTNTETTMDSSSSIETITTTTTKTTTTTRTTKTTKGKVAMFAAHPHGLVPSGTILNAILPEKDEWKNGVTTCIHQHIFNIPIVRELALWLGLINITADNMRRQLKEKAKSIYFLPGGSAEMIIDVNNPIQRVHEGFLRISFQENVPVISVLHFGQEDVFPSYSCQCLNALRYIILKMTGYPYPCIFFGPYSAQLTTVILKPLSPQDFESENAFIEFYYDRVTTKYASLKEMMVSPSSSLPSHSIHTDIDAD